MGKVLAAFSFLLSTLSAPLIAGSCINNNNCLPNEHCLKGECVPKDAFNRCISRFDCALGLECIDGVCMEEPRSTPAPTNPPPSSGGGGGYSGGGGFSLPSDRYFQRQEIRGNGTATRVTGDLAPELAWLRSLYPQGYDFVGLARRNRDFPCSCGLYNEKIMLFRIGETNSLRTVTPPAQCDTDECVIRQCQQNYASEIANQCEYHWTLYKKKEATDAK